MWGDNSILFVRLIYSFLFVQSLSSDSIVHSQTWIHFNVSVSIGDSPGNRISFDGQLYHWLNIKLNTWSIIISLYIIMSCKKQKTKLIYVIWHIIIAFYKAWNFVALLQKYRKNMDKRPRINVLSVLEVEIDISSEIWLPKLWCKNR